jgi:hypothetical protein
MDKKLEKAISPLYKVFQIRKQLITSERHSQVPNG